MSDLAANAGASGATPNPPGNPTANTGTAPPPGSAPPVNPVDVLSTQLSLFFAGIMAISFLGLLVKTKRMSWWTATILLNGIFAALSGASQLLLPPNNPATTQAVGQALISLSILFEFIFLHIVGVLVFPPISKALTIFLHMVFFMIVTAVPVWRIGLVLAPTSPHLFNLSMAEQGFEVVYFLMLLVIVIVWRMTKEKVATVMFCVGLVAGIGSSVFFLAVLWKVSTRTINTLLTLQSSVFMIDHVNNVFKRKTSYFIPPERLPGRRPVNSLMVLDFGADLDSRVKSVYHDSHRVKDIPAGLNPVPSPLLLTGSSRSSQMFDSPAAKSVVGLQRPESALLTPTAYSIEHALSFPEPVSSPTASVKTARARANSLPWRIHPALEDSMHLTRTKTSPSRKLSGNTSSQRKPVSTLPSPIATSYSRDQGSMVRSYYETKRRGTAEPDEQYTSRVGNQAMTSVRPDTRSLMPPLPSLPSQPSPKAAQSHDRKGSNASSRSNNSDRVPRRKGSNDSNRSTRSDRPRRRKRSDASESSIDVREVEESKKEDTGRGNSAGSPPRQAFGLTTIVEASENGIITDVVIPPPPPAAFAHELKPSLFRKPSVPRGLQRSLSTNTNASSSNSLFTSRFSDASIDMQLDADSNGSPSSNIDPNTISIMIAPPDSPTVKWI